MSNTHMRGGQDYGVRHLNANQTTSLESIVAGVLASETAPALSASELVLLGSVYVSGERILNPEALIRAGDMVRVHTQPRRYPQIPELRRRIITQSEGYLTVDKPAGVPVHAMVDNARENLLAYLQTELACPVFITHRLDIETSGVILIALSAQAQSELNKKLAAKQVRRHYLAFTTKPIVAGAYVHYMEDSPTAPKIMHDHAAEKHLRCELTVLSCVKVAREDLEARWNIDSLTGESIYMLSIELGTGRTQQIRAQLAHLGAPIISDQVYGNKSCLFDRLTLRRAIGLRAETLSFT